MRFSQRQGITPTEKLAQRESIDTELMNSLWNALFICYFERVEFRSYRQITKDSNLFSLIQQLWLHYFKKQVDNIPYSWDDTEKQLKNYFFKCQWYEVFDFIEAVSKFGHPQVKNNFIKTCNSYLSRENSAYRFVCEQITEITSKQEIEAVQEASSSKFAPVNRHFKTALNLLNDRENPDYRNSIKESISAIESLVKTLTNDKKATLGQALKALENANNLHPALKSSLTSLYGYTSDADGIRHALLSEPSLTKSDAKFMLVSCSAFANYLTEIFDTKK